MDIAQILPYMGIFSILVNGFMLIKLNPIINRLELMNQTADDHKKRLEHLEQKDSVSQTNNIKLAVIEERQKTAEAKIDQIVLKVDRIIDKQNA